MKILHQILIITYLICLLGCNDNNSNTVEQTINHKTSNDVIVFVGNSLTYYNNLPDILKDIGLANGKNITTFSYTRGGFTLEDLYTTPDAVSLVEKYHPNYLVIQEQSQTVDINAIRQWIALGEKNGAHVILYHTWVDNCQEMIDKAKNEKNLLIAPAGYAFNKFNEGQCRCPKSLESLPTLTHKNDFHPSEIGSYLAALTIYQTIYSQTAVNPPNSKIAQQHWKKLTESLCD